MDHGLRQEGGREGAWLPHFTSSPDPLLSSPDLTYLTAVSKVPSHIPILLLANFTDQGHHRQVAWSPDPYFVPHLLI